MTAQSAWSKWTEHYIGCKTCSLDATVNEDDLDVFCKTGRRLYEAAWPKASADDG